ncbi:hypothetical protein MNBD_GAMMA13-1244 [hydrothermal vent metagenome]|uniref:Uncharacterized protein n=1 Tax=hydrothermal vent metagenome TaxID=652676 RepID=A0A3B0Z458_9ZZZZ
MDDKLARRAASHLGLQVIGTGGVLTKARQMGRIPAVAPLLERLRAKGYHLSPGLITNKVTTNFSDSPCTSPSR